MPTPTPTPIPIPLPTPTLTPTPTPVPLPWPTPSAPVACTVDDIRNSVSYSSGGAQVAGAFYRPQATGYQPQPIGPLPAVLVLHTRGGLSSHERGVASWLASQGYVALAPDYFAPAGVNAQTYDLNTFMVQYTDRVREHLANGLECLKSLAYVDKERIGVVGFSLGGYLALVLATREDIKAVVSYYGAYHGAPVSAVPTKYAWGDIVAQVKAPALMLHGEADTTAPVTRASTTHRLLVEKGKQAELVVYPDVEHQFDRPGSSYHNIRVAIQAQARTQAFLAARLK